MNEWLIKITQFYYFHSVLFVIKSDLDNRNSFEKEKTLRLKVRINLCET